jgi:hypothetical protein
MENGTFIDGLPILKMVIFHLLMTNIANWKIPKINGGL